MKRLLLGICSWMAISAALAQTPESASVVCGCFSPTPQEALRVNSECWVSPNQVRDWGWKAEVKRNSADIDAEGRHLRVQAKKFGGDTYILLSEAADQLGAVSWWEDDSYRIAGDLRNIKFDGSHIQVDSTLSFKMSTFTLDSPKRLVVDLNGVSLREGKEYDLPDGVRMAQFAPQIVRIVIERNDIRAPKTSRPNSQRFLDLDLSPFSFDGPVTEPPFNTNTTDPNAGGTVTTTTIPSLKLDVTPILQIAAIADQESGSTVTIGADRKIVSPFARYDGPTTLILEFSGVKIGEGKDLSGTSKFVESMTAAPAGGGKVRFVLQLKKPLVFRMTGNGSNVSIQLTAPKNANGRLAGKIIAIDAGHGGSDPGTQAAGFSEKNITLAVSKMLAEELTEAGASVYMVRDKDIYIPVGDHAHMANKAGADLYVSVHVNSNSVDNTTSGLITFYHNQDPDSMLLANCMFKEVGKVNDIPDIGVWSDTRIYQTGFAVLRISQMPATLIELGFLNHKTDRAKLVNPQWQKRVAGAIARGVKLYFGDVSKENTP